MPNKFVKQIMKQFPPYANRTDSSIAGTYAPKESGRFADSRGVSYIKLRSGEIIDNPISMREVKSEARRTRLSRRANFRIEKRFAAITEKATV